MEINDELVDKLADLSRLKFNEAEKVEIKKDLEKMIGFFDKLQEVDTNGVEPLLHMSAAKNIMRPDQVLVETTSEDALKNAPDADKNYFRVPKVIRK